LQVETPGSITGWHVIGHPPGGVEEKSRLLDESDGFRLLLQRQKEVTGASKDMNNGDLDPGIS
jgi:hypothetical protein